MGKVVVHLLLVLLAFIGTTAFALSKCEEQYGGSTDSKVQDHYSVNIDSATMINGEPVLAVVDENTAYWGDVVDGLLIPEGTVADVTDSHIGPGDLIDPLSGPPVTYRTFLTPATDPGEKLPKVDPTGFNKKGTPQYSKQFFNESLNRVEIANIYNEAIRGETEKDSFNNFYNLLKQKSPNVPPAADVAAYLRNHSNQNFCMAQGVDPTNSNGTKINKKAFLFKDVRDLVSAVAKGLTGSDSASQNQSSAPAANAPAANGMH